MGIDFHLSFKGTVDVFWVLLIRVYAEGIISTVHGSISVGIGVDVKEAVVVDIPVLHPWTIEIVLVSRRIISRIYKVNIIALSLEGSKSDSFRVVTGDLNSIDDNRNGI